MGSDSRGQSSGRTDCEALRVDTSFVKQVTDSCYKCLYFVHENSFLRQCFDCTPLGEIRPIVTNICNMKADTSFLHFK